MSILKTIADLFGGKTPRRALDKHDLAILGALHVAEGEWMTAAEISRAYGIWGWHLWPPLARLERMGLIVARWEEADWPRRRFYTLNTDRGR